MLQPLILVVNLGASSSKFALFRGADRVADQTVQLAPGEMRLSSELQQSLRLEQLRSFIAAHEVKPSELAAVAARGGLTRPLHHYGAFLVDGEMLEDLRSERYGWHPSSLSAVIACELLREAGLSTPVYVVDPVSVDTMWEPARVSGMAGIERSGRHHALNVHASILEAARRLGKPADSVDMVVAHFGSGVSICSVVGGRVVDVNDAQLGEGPFSVSRAGTLPLRSVLDLAYSGIPRNEVERRLSREGGMYSYLGTADFKEITDRIEAGDQEASAIYAAMLYQSKKAIYGAAGALPGQPGAVVLTGALMHSARFRDDLRRSAARLARVIVLPGEQEMEALARGVIAALSGESDEAVQSGGSQNESQGGGPGGLSEIRQRAMACPSCLFVIAGAGQADVLQTVARACDLGLGRFKLLGKADDIAGQLAEFGGPATMVEILDSSDPVRDALSVVHRSTRSVLVKGACDSAKLLRGILDGLPREPRPFLSHCALLENPFAGKVVALTDGGLNPEPDIEAKIRIMRNAAGLMRRLGLETPKVLLAAGMEDKGQAASSVADARSIMERHRAGEWPDLVIDGPFGLDVGLLPEAARAKGISSAVAGCADIILMPSLEACNFAVKMAHYYGAQSWAGIVMGGNYPVVLGSRADDEESRLASLALARLMAD